MSNVAQNPDIYFAALAGALGGMFGDRGITSPAPSDYAPEVAVAQAWAQALDTAWASTPVTPLAVQCVEDCSISAWIGRGAPADGSFAVASRWSIPANAIKAAALEAGLSVADQGIVTPPLFMTGTTPGLAPSETVELLPFLILQNNAETSIEYTAACTASDVDDDRFGATIVRSRLTCTMRNGNLSINSLGTAATSGDATGATWTITPSSDLAPTRVKLTFSTGEAPVAAKVRARISTVTQAF
jgi:hypothetical protein